MDAKARWIAERLRCGPVGAERVAAREFANGHGSFSLADVFAPPPSRQQNPIPPCTKKRSVNY